MPQKPDPDTLRLIVEHYRRSDAEREAEDLWWKAEGQPFEKACERAAKALDVKGNLHSHHWRRGYNAMGEFARVLVAQAASLKRAKDFDGLLEEVERSARSFTGAGELVAYDVADRIGLHLGLAPREVYLHAGTRTGAHNLGLGTASKTRSIRVEDLPPPLSKLAPRDAENVLCTYSSKLLMSPEDCLHALADKPGSGCSSTRRGRGRRGC